MTVGRLGQGTTQNFRSRTRFQDYFRYECMVPNGVECSGNRRCKARLDGLKYRKMRSNYSPPLRLTT